MKKKITVVTPMFNEEGNITELCDRVGAVMGKQAYFLAKLVFWDAFALGIAPVVLGFFFFSAVQMIFLGILGEYIGSIQTHVRNLPHVVEAERVNFD